MDYKVGDRVVVVQDNFLLGYAGENSLIGRRGSYVAPMSDGLFDHEIVLDGEVDSLAVHDDEIEVEPWSADYDSMLDD